MSTMSRAEPGLPHVFSPDGAQILSVGYLRLGWLDQKEWLAG